MKIILWWKPLGGPVLLLYVGLRRRGFSVRSCWARTFSLPGYGQYGPFQVFDLERWTQLKVKGLSRKSLVNEKNNT